jgi:hypothetical protein
MLQTCSQIYVEADHIFRQYVSLYREMQMLLAFHHFASETQKMQIIHADVANDGRIIEDIITQGHVRRSF